MVVVEEAFPLSVGLSVSDNHSQMEGPFNGTLQDTQKIEEVESLSEDNKEQLVVELDEVPAADGDGDAKSMSLIETSSVVDIAITDEQATQDEENVEEVVEETETEDVPESVNVSSPNESSDEVKADQVDNTLASDTVELELKEDKGEDFVSLEDTNGLEEKTEELPPSEDNDDGLRGSTEVVETTKDMTVVEEEEDVLLSSVIKDGEELNPIADVVPKEYDEIDKVVPPKGIEKVEEQLDAQEASSYESTKESYQPLPNVAHAESNSVTVQDNIEEPRSIENPPIISVTQRQHTSWTSCCGLLEVLRHGDR